MKILNAFWDLRWWPINYEIVQWLCMAEAKRQDYGYDGIRVIFVPPGGKLAKEHIRPPKVEYWRLWNQVIPTLRLMPTITGCHVLSHRQEAWSFQGLSFPTIYNPDAKLQPTKDYGWIYALRHAKLGNLPSLHVSDVALRNVEQWLTDTCRGRKPVVLVERADPRYYQRNTNQDAWQGFVKNLNLVGYCPIWLRDAGTIYRQPRMMQGLHTFDVASQNVELRAALYQSSHLVMGTLCGNMSLALLNKDVNYVLFTNPHNDTEMGDSWFKARGFKAGEQPIFAGPHQKWVWANDDYEHIMQAFEEYENGSRLVG